MNAIANAAMFEGAARYIEKYQAKANAASSVEPRNFVELPPQTMDRITFNTPDDGMQAGYVAMITRHIGNGERFAWVELDNALPGSFRCVPLTQISSCDDCGNDRRNALSDPSVRRLCLNDFSGAVVDAKNAAQG